MGYNREMMPVPQVDDSILQNIFETAKITSENAIPGFFKVTNSHPNPACNLTAAGKEIPLPTNDSSTALMVKANGVPSYQQPYIFTITEKNEIAVSATNPQRKVRGDNYVYNPVGIHSLLISVSANDRHVTVEPPSSTNSFSYGAKITMYANQNQEIFECPIIQGAGLVSVLVKPSSNKVEIGSAVGIRNFSSLTVFGKNEGFSNIELHDSSCWVMKVTSQNQTNVMCDNGIVGVEAPSGCLIQFFPTSLSQQLGNQLTDSFFASLCFGSYVASFKPLALKGSESMSFEYDVRSYVNTLQTNCEALLFLLPHHLDILAPEMSCKKTGIVISSSVYGIMSGFVTRSIRFDFSMEDISKYDIFKPQSLLSDRADFLKSNANIIKQIVLKDLQDTDISRESDLNSMYFAGKVFNKYAWLLFISHNILHEEDLSTQIFSALTLALERFMFNQQQLPLVYDESWKGMISSGSSGEDFGNSYYNDHHFHYGYFVLTFAILADYDYNWFTSHKAYSDLLLRDYCNLDINDLKFINFRNFNWFSGHSWANGIWPSLDGKDQESSSEDYNSVYAMLLYGSVTGNSEMSQIAKFQLNTMKYSNNCYFLYQRNNLNIFREILPNKVAGIFFQNKIDYATYFGKNTEYIHMIHFIPGTFITEYIRQKEFVREEWEEKLQNLNLSESGWNGLLKLNQSMIDANAANFFKDTCLNKSNLDGGQSQSYSLVLSLLWGQNI